MSRSVVVATSTDGTAREEYLTLAEVAAWSKRSRKRVRNNMYDGTWQKGVHWFSPRGIGPRFKLSALVRWLEGQDTPQSDAGKGLAYSADIPLPCRGRPRRVDGRANPRVQGA